ncbi:ABC transporter permease [Cellulomonas bogoriensis]|uniref:ABC transporter permease n=1 Tax=Cellulomonas bogoriensis 69B4 = DSM 16987 TaxID=1386082 RepID=A0A0A0BM01_9CELL|nr:ABC transporter permease [Cellulomonas bogoriensis]KGM08910.1 ABC transporter permease [Cellulomonas bogoriensis 69B4 = DSM 16987]
MTATVAPTAVTTPRVVASEWVKVRSLRSTVWTLVSAVVLMVGLSLLMAWGEATLGGGEGPRPGPLASVVTSGVFVAQIPVAVLGVLLVTGEYTTGMIRSTLAAVPRRTPALLAKAVVLTLTVLVVGAVAAALSLLVAMPFAATLDPAVGLTEPESLRMLAGVPLYLVVVALLGMGAGALLRSSAGAIAGVLGLVLIVESVFASLPFTFFTTVSPFLPTTAAARLAMSEEMLVMTAVGDAPVLGPWQGFAVGVAWVLALLAAAAVLLRTRDA